MNFIKRTPSITPDELAESLRAFLAGVEVVEVFEPTPLVRTDKIVKLKAEPPESWSIAPDNGEVYAKLVKEAAHATDVYYTLRVEA